ncbi:MAG: hypothetical protein M9894_14015 [Planctomycetes bacterium]|nr:hypothetical protein [Planctomycetota bacterium]
MNPGARLAIVSPSATTSNCPRAPTISCASSPSSALMRAASLAALGW